ncbi:glycosyltransferase [Sulfitobacter mediterraneus]|uniref:glycosyltransferase n=1 Tax=Sulfitobacter mediterraneus TaxID=83219 RepID=UPI0024920D71|nr:glycosyltransferase [Sulfitobacter mediterraneus]
MNILLIHQNFPGQFKYLGPELAKQGHVVVAFSLKAKKPTTWLGIRILPYKVGRRSAKGIHPWLVDFETKLVRAEACYDAALKLRDRSGFSPDVILAHHGWGEAMFLRDLWPEARLGLYCEFFSGAEAPCTNFDPEFASSRSDKNAPRLRIKNLSNRMHFDIASAGVSPTAFQADTFPSPFRKKIEVIHDGVDTNALHPDPEASFVLPEGRVLTRGDEIITFVNRNLEPYRGYHIFMRALPDLLRLRPNAQVLVTGADGVSYSKKPPQGKTWKQIFIDEVRGQIDDADWDRVHFLGTLPYANFVQMLQVSRLHIYLTYPFVLSWSLLEIMSVGGTVLASDTAPVRELIRDGETGALIDFFDSDALVARATELLDNQEASHKLGRAAREHVIKNYDVKQICLPQQLAWVDRLAAMPRLRLPL